MRIDLPASWNSLRGIIKYLKKHSDDEIVHLNLPTLLLCRVYVWVCDNLNFVGDYFLNDPRKKSKTNGCKASPSGKVKIN